jgi:hypothetical protein
MPHLFEWFYLLVVQPAVVACAIIGKLYATQTEPEPVERGPLALIMDPTPPPEPDDPDGQNTL